LRLWEDREKYNTYLFFFSPDYSSARSSINTLLGICGKRFPKQVMHRKLWVQYARVFCPPPGQLRALALLSP
jgi:hypothetical protein